jgi:hypothetical protein
MRHSGLPGKRRSVFGESIFTPRARALFVNPYGDLHRYQSGSELFSMDSRERTSLSGG